MNTALLTNERTASPAGYLVDDAFTAYQAAEAGQADDFRIDLRDLVASFSPSAATPKATPVKGCKNRLANNVCARCGRCKAFQ